MVVVQFCFFSPLKQCLVAFKNSRLNWFKKAKSLVKRHGSLNFEDISLLFQELWKHNYRKAGFSSSGKSFMSNTVVTNNSYL